MYFHNHSNNPACPYDDRRDDEMQSLLDIIKALKEEIKELTGENDKLWTLVEYHESMTATT